ncbi:type III restriction-modification system endonuclease [Candidatus Venteria ishoeyi]|uniref:Type III restriction enzyme, res subunit n=1 Tax=Candidatus Venteria ishoeyi TaxID=1899563 RepID=A0A1H6F552_9GAMM|nr:DEAD/DEAH box helicase family protein [Candidatus Venteria ishoeyi]SEH05232.1 Type III restriction enzyme%2C res subunit [Candidatus Venteria ishoeyi]
MKLKFKKQAYQTRAVESVVDCFKGQPNTANLSYRIDSGTQDINLEYMGFKNNDIFLTPQQILENIQEVQRNQNLPQSQSVSLFKTLKKNVYVEDKNYSRKALAITSYHFDIEMETGTGKTYCYIKTIFEMNKRFGWTKFIIVVPSIAIREGVYKSLEITAEHFQETYGKKAKFFIYNSKQLHNLESFSSDAGINIMVINVQAFNARGKDNRRIYEELDDFQSRRPIDVIKVNHPVLILDEPQKMEGVKTLDSLKEFNPLFILRYSATHKTQHNKVHRLDALDAYNQKLVKKIAIRGISVKGLSGTNAYLYLESIEVSKQMPMARIEIEVKQNSGIKRMIRKLKKGDNFYDLSGELDQYKGFVIADINAITDTVEFTNGHQLQAGEATGDVNATALRRIQIREAIKAHFEKEQVLYHQGIKVLTLFFIDEVAKYRVYTDAGEEGGEYAKIFEEEYKDALNKLKQDMFMHEGYKKHLDSIPVDRTHNGYFSIDKKGKLVDSKETGRGTDKQCHDVDAYDLILKDKERLLSFDEATRFIFSHSALREGWDNPNVFVICTLKHSDNTILRRQEVGRGLRIAVNQLGDRQDNPATVHQTNVLTVVASESYKDFVTALQRDISESLSERPRVADVKYFTSKIMQVSDGTVEVTQDMAEGIEFYLIQNGYVDRKKNIAQKYHDALKNEELADLPEDLQPYKEQVFQLIDSVYSDAKLPEVENDRGTKTNPLNANFEKKAFKSLWNRINRKAVYSVHFDSAELVGKCIQTLNKELRVKSLEYNVQRGEQAKSISYDQMKFGNSFKLKETSSEHNVHSIHSAVKYDLIGKVAENVQLTRHTVTEILSGLEKPVFAQFKNNPESFISEATRLIQEQKASVIIEHLSYDAVTETHDIDIFTDGQSKQDFSKAGDPLKRHIYDYVITDSKTERNFVKELDTSSEVVVYAKLPKGFSIPTPVGNYNPDWAISFKEGTVKHVYFVAETKGSMSSMELREIEKTKIKCARKFFDEINRKIDPENVKYGVVNSFSKLMEIVGAGAI